MKVSIDLSSGLPLFEEDFGRSTTICDIKKRIEAVQRVLTEDCSLFFMDSPLEDHLTLGDLIPNLIFGDEVEPSTLYLTLHMEQRCGTVIKIFDEKKWLIHGVGVDLEWKLLSPEDPGFSIRSSVFGIANQGEEVNGSKIFTAQMFQCNPNHWNFEYRQVVITGIGNDMKISKIKTNDTVKELRPYDRVVYDEVKNKLIEGTVNRSQSFIAAQLFVKQVAEYVKNATKPCRE